MEVLAVGKKQFVYSFWGGQAEGSAGMQELLGKKGADLAEMCRLGIPVPAGFTITTKVCAYFHAHKRRYPSGLKTQVKQALAKLQAAMGAGFGDTKNPLLLSMRLGGTGQMPGMLPAVLNLGLNHKTLQGLIAQTDNPRFAYDTYCRFLNSYARAVMGFKPQGDKEHDRFKQLLAPGKGRTKTGESNGPGVDELAGLAAELKELIEKRLGKAIPDDPMEQLWGAIGAAFGSCSSPRAESCRQIHGIPFDWSAAVNVQAMVFGNMGDNSAAGVGFTRDPNTGENYFYGEYLSNAQGEDLLAGLRIPWPINRAKPVPRGIMTLEDQMPRLYKQLVSIRSKLEKHYGDMQAMEFTIQKGKLWILQTHPAERSAASAIKVAVDMVKERLIHKREAVARVTPDQLDQLLHPLLDPKAEKMLLTKGLPASPGAAVGQAVFNPHDAEALAQKGGDPILVILEAGPDDFRGIHAARGVLTCGGGVASHAAVMARGMGKPCVAAAGAISITHNGNRFKVGKQAVKKGDWISLDGSGGQVFWSRVPQVEPKLGGDFGRFMKWADEFRTLKVRANTNIPNDAGAARAFGADGIGLARTEYMFLAEERIAAMREMILAGDAAGRQAALDKILPGQKDDFIAIFRVMAGFPVAIRTLDMALHEFMPHSPKEISALAKEMGVKPGKLRAKLESLNEFNPRLGHRGCRLGMVYPEITAMQARAVMEAACLVASEGLRVRPEIMIPLVAHQNEFKRQKQIIAQVAGEVMSSHGIKIRYRVGCMIELPRAILIADQLASQADFFSFGTNDLTQTTYGINREDGVNFLPAYVNLGVFGRDPFATLDFEGVGGLISQGLKAGRAVKKNLRAGICGEHGGDPRSVEFFHNMGLDYVSCSPYRVPMARLAAAQAALAQSCKKK
jgi:pyruvate,orthophosphate dikinase